MKFLNGFDSNMEKFNTRVAEKEARTLEQVKAAHNKLYRRRFRRTMPHLEKLSRKINVKRLQTKKEEFMRPKALLRIIEKEYISLSKTLLQHLLL